MRDQQKRSTRGPVELWQTTPVSRLFGTDRGNPIDRYYIEKFLNDHSADIRGSVLEVGDDTYTRRFGAGRVLQSEVLHAVAGNPKSTLVADLATADSIPAERYDCVILTQTLQFIYDVPAALRHVRRILRPTGVLLATCAGISQISRYDMDRWGDYWRFTSLSLQKLLEKPFGGNCEIQSYGNVLAATAFLHGLACDELTRQELDHVDPDYELLLAVRAVAGKSA